MWKRKFIEGRKMAGGGGGEKRGGREEANMGKKGEMLKMRKEKSARQEVLRGRQKLREITGMAIGPTTTCFEPSLS